MPTSTTVFFNRQTTLGRPPRNRAIVSYWRELGRKASYNLAVPAGRDACALPARPAARALITAAGHQEQRAMGKAGMIRILTAVLALAVLAVVALAVYSYLGDMTPELAPVSQPVVLDVD
jgi:hypothetical protein